MVMVRESSDGTLLVRTLEICTNMVFDGLSVARSQVRFPVA
jgi:hypothetical protein